LSIDVGGTFTDSAATALWNHHNSRRWRGAQRGWRGSFGNVDGVQPHTAPTRRTGPAIFI
jgi:hypothetical protein